MPIKTKAQIEAELGELTEKFSAFRKNVVDTALKTAERHDWCEVVTETLVDLGLDDLLPNTFGLEEKRSARSKWKPFNNGFENPKDAIAEAKEYRESVVRIAKWRFNNEHGGNSKSLYIKVGVGADIDKAIAEIKRQHASLLPKEAETFVEPAYPQYRAVELNAKGEVVRVLEG